MPGRSLIVAAAACALAASAQTTDKTFYLTHTNTRALQQMANLIRSIGDIKAVTVNEDKLAIAVHGTEEQVSIAGWLCSELDKTPAPISATVKHEYPGTTTGNLVLRVFLFAHVPSPQALQEVVNATRSVADIQRFFPYFELNAAAVRGAADQVTVADWVMSELDKPAPSMQTLSTEDHAVTFDQRSNLAQVVFLANTKNPKAVQEIVNLTRSISDLQRLFPCHSAGALVMRGSPEQVALADWLLKALDKPASQPTLDSAVHEYKVPATVWPEPSIARIYYLGSEQTPQALQELVNTVRTTTKVQRVYPNAQANAIAMRGTGDQLAQAEQLIKERM